MLAESLLIGVVSSLLGTLAGIGFAKLLILVITSQGGGFPKTPLVLAAPTWVVAAVVGVGVTLGVSVVPAWRAGRVSPVTAMRDGAALMSDSIRARTVLGVADHAAIMVHGRIVRDGSPAELEQELSSAYLGAQRGDG